VRHGDARPASWTSALASHHTDGVILVTTELTEAQLMAVGGASDSLPLTGAFTLTGPARVVGSGRVLDTPASVHDLAD
jgi:hypothetical protein